MDIGWELQLDPLTEQCQYIKWNVKQTQHNTHRTEIYLICSSILEKFENFISMELCEESSSGLIVDFRKPFNIFKDVGFLSVSVKTFMPSELRDIYMKIKYYQHQHQPWFNDKNGFKRRPKKKPQTKSTVALKHSFIFALLFR